MGAWARQMFIAIRVSFFLGVSVGDPPFKEPLPQDHPFRASDHSVLTPHLGYGVAETWGDFYPRSVENAEAFLDGKSIRVLDGPKRSSS